MKPTKSASKQGHRAGHTHGWFAAKKDTVIKVRVDARTAAKFARKAAARNITQAELLRLLIAGCPMPRANAGARQVARQNQLLALIASAVVEVARQAEKSPLSWEQLLALDMSLAQRLAELEALLNPPPLP